MRSLLLMLLLPSLLLAAAPAPAAGPDDQDRARDAVRSGSVRPLDDILSIVRRNYPGRVLDAGLNQGGGRWFYDIRLLGPGGQVTDLRVDAGSAEVLEVRRGGGRSRDVVPRQGERPGERQDGWQGGWQSERQSERQRDAGPGWNEGRGPDRLDREPDPPGRGVGRDRGGRSRAMDRGKGGGRD